MERIYKPMSNVSIRQRIGCPQIEPVAEGIHRPFWSVMIPSYNQIEYLEPTLRSVLEQDPGPDEMQIEVIDNCSTQGDPEFLVKDIGGRRVSFHRQPHNIGATRNFNTCIEHSLGQVVHILHSDDSVLPGFYERTRTILSNFPNCGMVVNRVLLIDAQGNELGTSKALSDSSGLLEQYHLKMNTENPIRAPGVVVRRSVYELLGGFDVRLATAPDWEMWLRISANTAMWYEHEVLSIYRIHPASGTALTKISGAYIDEARKVIDVAVRRLPISNVKEFRNVAFRTFASCAVAEGHCRAVSRDIVGTARFLWKAARCSPTMRTFWRSFRIVARATKHRYL